MQDPKVGESVYYVPRDGREKPQWMRVEKVGRKWVELQFRRRMDRETWVMEGSGSGYSSPGQCYRTKEEYDDVVSRNHRWGYIREKVSQTWHAPEGVDLAEVERALGLNKR